MSSRIRRACVAAAAVLFSACSDALSPVEVPLEPVQSTASTSSLAITNVTSSTGRRYEVVNGGLTVGSRRYTDRSTYTFLAPIPAELQGAMLIRTPNDDKYVRPGSSSLVSFDVSHDVTVYVAHDNRLQRPAWLLSGWTDTGMSLINFAGTAPGYRIFRRNFPRGRVTLGSNVASTVLTGGSMYTIAVRVRNTSTRSSECTNPRPEWIFCDDFEQDRLRQYFEFDARNGSFARVAGVGRNGSMGMRARWSSIGQVNAGSLKLAFGRTPSSYMRPVDAGTARYRRIYWRVYVRNQPGWTGGGADKLSRASVMTGSNWSQAMIAHVWSGGSSTSNPFLVLDPASGTSTSGTLRTTKYNDFANLRWLGSRRGQTALFSGDNLGKWHCVESYVRLNDAGQSNGVFRLWVNGALDAERTGLNWLGSYDRYGINTVFLENYWNKGTPRAQERYFDNFVVSTSRIGC